MGLWPRLAYVQNGPVPRVSHCTQGGAGGLTGTVPMMGLCPGWACVQGGPGPSVQLAQTGPLPRVGLCPE